MNRRVHTPRKVGGALKTEINNISLETTRFNYEIPEHRKNDATGINDHPFGAQAQALQVAHESVWPEGHIHETGVGSL
jgi:hypothetical protein